MYDTIIIGGGIAGTTAAIYASRKRMKFLLIAKELGGQFLESGEILNYPGIIKTDGVQFSSVVKKQLEFNDVMPNAGEEVKKIEKIKNGFQITSGKKSYESKTVIIASGSKPKKLNIPGEAKYANKGVAYCSICDGPLFSGKDIAIIGGGNSALEGVDFTKDIARKIYLINIEKKFRAHEYLIEKTLSYQNVEVINQAKITEITGDKFVTGLKYQKKGKENYLDIKGVIVEIGRIPVTDFLGNFLKIDQHKHILVDCQTRTSVEGVFAAGDCASGHEYQYIIAAGAGAMALLKAARYMANKT